MRPILLAWDDAKYIIERARRNVGMPLMKSLKSRREQPAARQVPTMAAWCCFCFCSSPVQINIGDSTDSTPITAKKPVPSIIGGRFSEGDPRAHKTHTNSELHKQIKALVSPLTRKIFFFLFSSG